MSDIKMFNTSESRQPEQSGGMELLRTSSGEVKGGVYPKELSGSGHYKSVVFWRVPDLVWEMERPIMEIHYVSGDDDEFRVDERFELPAKEGSLVMDREIRYQRVRYSAEAHAAMRQAAAVTPPPPIPLPKLIEQRDGEGRLIGCSYADADICGYGWQENVIFWRMTELGWDMDPDQVAMVMYTPADGSPMEKIVFDETFDVTSREGSRAMEREIAFAMVCTRASAKYYQSLMP